MAEIKRGEHCVAAQMCSGALKRVLFSNWEGAGGNYRWYYVGWVHGGAFDQHFWDTADREYSGSTLPDGMLVGSLRGACTRIGQRKPAKSELTNRYGVGDVRCPLAVDVSRKTPAVDYHCERRWLESVHS